MKITIPDDAKAVCSLIAEKLGEDKIFLVGGFVRDRLMHSSSHDIDIATSVVPYEVAQAFPYGYASSFGTVSFKRNGYSITIATRRQEKGYKDYRHPSTIHYVQRIKDEYKRRDFTVNCLYSDRQGTIIDPSHKGLKDIRKRKLSRIGKPKKRIEEDPLRILRAYRFSKELGLTLAPSLKRARIWYKDLAKNLKKETVRQEVKKCPEAYRDGRIEYLDLGFAFEEKNHGN